MDNMFSTTLQNILFVDRPSYKSEEMRKIFGTLKCPPIRGPKTLCPQYGTIPRTMEKRALVENYSVHLPRDLSDVWYRPAGINGAWRAIPCLRSFSTRITGQVKRKWRKNWFKKRARKKENEFSSNRLKQIFSKANFSLKRERGSWVQIALFKGSVPNSNYAINGYSPVHNGISPWNWSECSPN